MSDALSESKGMEIDGHNNRICQDVAIGVCRQRVANRRKTGV